MRMLQMIRRNPVVLYMLAPIFIGMILFLLFLYINYLYIDKNIDASEEDLVKDYIIDLGKQSGKKWIPDYSNFHRFYELDHQWIFMPNPKCNIYISASDPNNIDVVGAKGECGN